MQFRICLAFLFLLQSAILTEHVRTCTLGMQRLLYACLPAMHLVIGQLEAATVGL